MVLDLVPIKLREAKAFVRQTHRHNDAPRGWLFGVGLEKGGTLVAVGIAGRPVARALDDGLTVEITRIASTGERNACSKLYGALTRAAFALGYRRIVTYTLEQERGASLRAAGFERRAIVAERSGWDCPARPRKSDPSPRGAKVRWEKEQDLG